MTETWAIDWVRGVTLDGAGLAAAALLVAWLLIGEPLVGRRAWRAYKAALAAAQPGARTRFYRAWTWQSWLLVAITLVLALGVLGWTPQQLGLRWAALPITSLGGGFIVGAAGAAIAGFVVGAVLAKRRAARDTANTAATANTTTAATASVAGDVLAMLPTTRAERGHYALLALTAGITEETIWRGFLLALLVALFPAAPAWLLLVPMALVFGWAHLYQGRSGVLVTALLGAILGGIYIATASLIVPMLLHVLIDLRALLTPAVRNNGA